MLTKSKLLEVERILAKAQNAELHGWAADLVEDIADRVLRNREYAYISASQLEQLTHIAEGLL